MVFSISLITNSYLARAQLAAAAAFVSNSRPDTSSGDNFYEREHFLLVLSEDSQLPTIDQSSKWREKACTQLSSEMLTD